MGGFASSVFGQAPGLSQAVAIPTPSLATGALLASQAAARTPAQSATGSTIASGAPTGPGIAAGQGFAGGAAAGLGVAPSPAQIAAQRTATVPSSIGAQESAYRRSVANALSSTYSQVASSLAPYFGGSGAATGEMELSTYAPNPAGAPVLSALQKQILGPGVTSSWPWGPGVNQVAGSSVLPPGLEGLAQAAGLTPGTGGFLRGGNAPGSFYPTDVFGNPTGAAEEASAVHGIGGVGSEFGPYPVGAPLPTGTGAATGAAPLLSAPAWETAYTSAPRGLEDEYLAGPSPWEAPAGGAFGSATFGG